MRKKRQAAHQEEVIGRLVEQGRGVGYGFDRARTTKFLEIRDKVLSFVRQYGRWHDAGGVKLLFAETESRSKNLLIRLSWL